MEKKFIDISEHNTILSITGMFNSNLSGVVMKATEGTTYQDHIMQINYDAVNGNMPIGFYHYLKSTSEPESQAHNFWNQIKDKQYQIIPILDVEDNGLTNQGLAQEYSDRFMKEFYELSGQRMLMYSYRTYIEDNFSHTFRNENIWWVADYGANTVPTISCCKIVAWQYTEDERSYAFTMGNLDVSILYDEDNFFLDKYFNGAYVESKTLGYNEAIATLQQELNEQGFTDKNFNELIVDGIAGELTLSACPIVRSGASGKLTKWIQTNLDTPVQFDGLFGEETRQAVIVYQENRSLVGDGIVGKETWRKLLGL